MIILFPKQVGCLLTQNHLDSKAVSCSKFKIARKPEAYLICNFNNHFYI